MSPLEIKDEEMQLLKEQKALRLIFGQLMLENTSSDSDELSYFQRKFGENQKKLFQRKITNEK